MMTTIENLANLKPETTGLLLTARLRRGAPQWARAKLATLVRRQMRHADPDRRREIRRVYAWAGYPGVAN